MIIFAAPANLEALESLYLQTNPYKHFFSNFDGTYSTFNLFVQQADCNLEREHIMFTDKVVSTKLSYTTVRRFLLIF